MVAVDTIQSLFQSLERLGNSELKSEMCNKLNQVRGAVVTLHEHLRAKDGEIQSLRMQLQSHGNSAGQIPGFIYDPPV